MLPPKTVARLSLYRRLLDDHWPNHKTNIYSHQLASMANVSSAQVRRDLMSINYSGSPNRGYSVSTLSECLADVLDSEEVTKVALFGIGHLGRALLSYFQGRRTKLSIVAAFDSDKDKVGRVCFGCQCYPIDDIETIINKEQIQCAILAVPSTVAQPITDRLISSGVKGILSYAPVPLKVPEDVFLEIQDMTMALEKIAYFARK